MKLTLAEPKFLVDTVSIVSELVNEVRIKVKKDNLEIVAMDPANVAMVIFKLLSSAFTEYDVKNEVELGIGLDNLKHILRRVKPSDTLILELDEERNRLRINLKGEKNRLFSLSLIDIEENEQKVPDLNFPIKVETSSVVFNDAIEDVGIVAESVALIIKEGNFTIQSEGTLSDAKVEINEDEETKVLSGKGEVMARYSVEYLKKIIKGSKLADNVTLQFNKDYPLKIDYNVIDKLSLSFVLAPRVSSD